MSNLDPISPTYSTATFSLPYASPIKQETPVISDSLSSVHQEPLSNWAPERPVLAPPHALPPCYEMSEYRLLATTEETRGLGNQILDTLGVRLKNVKMKISEISADNIHKLKEAAQRAADSSFWSTLKKIATCLLSAVSMVFGISLVASGGGALIGGTMIASGILSLSNFALSETGAWDWVSKQLSQDNEERQKMLAWIFPSAVGILAGGIGLVGSVQGIASGALQFTEKAVYVAQTALALFDGITTLGKGHADAHLIWTQADLAEIQANLTAERSNFDTVMKEIESSMSDFRAVKTKTKKIIQTLSNSNIQLVRQV